MIKLKKKYDKDFQRKAKKITKEYLKECFLQGISFKDILLQLKFSEQSLREYLMKESISIKEIKKEIVTELLQSNLSIKEIASKLNVSDESIYVWRKKLNEINKVNNKVL